MEFSSLHAYVNNQDVCRRCCVQISKVHIYYENDFQIERPNWFATWHVYICMYQPRPHIFATFEIILSFDSVPRTSWGCQTHSTPLSYWKNVAFTKKLKLRKIKNLLYLRGLSQNNVEKWRYSVYRRGSSNLHSNYVLKLIKYCLDKIAEMKAC